MGKTVMMTACHKKTPVPADPMYFPIFVGAAGKDDIGFQRDDSGDNISKKNPLYCELTGLYWCWKNLDFDYLGLCHYRRYFAGSKKKTDNPFDNVLTEKQAEDLLKEYRVLVPKKRHYYIETIYSHYSHTFSSEQLDSARDILYEKYPEYLKSWDRLMEGTTAYVFNMFMMDNEMTDRYCTWLFDVLEELEKRIDITGMTDFEKRYAGRVAERLFNVWLMHQVESGALRQEDIKEVPYIYFGKVRWVKKIAGFLAAKLFQRKYKASF